MTGVVNQTLKPQRIAVNTPVSWVNPEGVRLTGKISAHAFSVPGTLNYWVRVDGSTPTYYPHVIIVNHKELTVLA